MRHPVYRESRNSRNKQTCKVSIETVSEILSVEIFLLRDMKFFVYQKTSNFLAKASIFALPWRVSIVRQKVLCICFTIERKPITLFRSTRNDVLPLNIAAIGHVDDSEVTENFWIRCSFVSISVTYAYFRKQPDGRPDVVGVSNRDQDRYVESRIH